MAIAKVVGLRSALLLLLFALVVAANLPALRAEEATGSAAEEEGEEEEPSAVLTLDSSNFSETVAKHPFIVVEFYAPWCGHCKRLEPEYERAADALSVHDPPIVLAKVDAGDDKNREIAKQYDVRGYPTLKILRNGGKSVQDYNGPREADGIVSYLKKQSGPASADITSSEDASNLIGEKKIFIVGVFPKTSGEEYDNFIAVAEKMRGEYDFGHTLDASFLPRGDSSTKGPIVRLFKPFDELFVDFKDFQVDALQNFIEISSVPILSIFDKDPENHPYVQKFFGSPNDKAMFFLNFSCGSFDALKATYREVAEEYKGKGISFLIGDLEASQGALKYFGLKEDQVPILFVQKSDSVKYLKENVEPHQIAAWFKEYSDGSLTPYRKSEPIPEANDDPVKVVVGDSLNDMVFNSGKNVLLEFYAPWCGHCKKLAPILDEVAISLKDDTDVLIAKIDATVNDFPAEFKVAGYPTLYYYSSASKELVKYEGGQKAADIIQYLQERKGGASSQPEETKGGDDVKDEL